jgi:TFIIF-interacting CTD phosphatase-like protein
MINVVLDLDLTIISSITTSELKARRGVHYPFKYHVFADYIIYERPGLEDFLRDISKLGNVCVWTAASENYGEFIVDNIINPRLPEGAKVKLFLFSENCKASLDITGVLKHLDMIYDMSKYGFGPELTRQNTVLVDDNEGVLAQNSYVINAAPFEFDPADSELKRVFRKIKAMNK